jgi:hypothetical protein
MSETKQQQTMTEPEWQALGKALFGDDLTKWRFRCPTCGTVMSIEKARTMPAEQLAKLRESKWSVEQECIGRHVDAGCDWCAYGLFSGPFFVVRDGGNKTPVFGFDMSTSTTLPTGEG